MPNLPGPLSIPWVFTLVVIWSIVWKAIALWHSARNKQLGWYIAMLIINTIGLLEIIYLTFFRRERNTPYKFE
ncbi:MAG: DUF5652 family protein [Chitinophagales bacterium]